MKVTLIKFGEKTINERIYSYASVSEIPKSTVCTLDVQRDQHGHAILVPPINGDKTCALAEITMDVDGIYAEIKPYSDERGKLFEELMMNGCKIYPLGSGNTNENGEVSAYALHYVYLAK